MSKTFRPLSLLAFSLLHLSFFLPDTARAQGWPADYGGVMLQGFYWDSFTDTKWKNLQSQADELSQYFDLLWVPQSGKAAAGTSMGYDPLYYWNQNSSFGSEEQLRSMISALKERGTGVIADVVVNHRGNLSSWVDFPSETYRGVTYTMTAADICKNDDGGATASNNPGVSLSPNNDEGEDWSGMRDLDHRSANVKTIVKAYTKYLVEDLGYTGFRYDMVKGFGASHVADYNVHAGVQYSVGEYWDGNASVVQNWINGTKQNGIPQSAAFDFPFRYTCRDAISGEWSKLKNTSVASSAEFRRYAVTFIENHDTEKRSATNQQDPIRKDTLALNAWMLSMPGTPCIFLKHWQQWKQDLKNMIEMRRMAGITNQSTYSEFASNSNYCVRTVQGSKGNLRIAVGNYNGAAGNGFTEVLSGYHYRYFLSTALNAVWVNLPSGVYAQGESVEATLRAVTALSDYKLIYTTDGSAPTATHGTQVADGTQLTFTTDTELRVAILAAGRVYEVASRQYLFQQTEPEPPFEAFQLHLYVRSEVAQFNSRMNFYIWAGEADTQINGNWPGRQISEKVELGGYSWFHQTIDITKASQLPVNLVCSTGTGSPQTVDATGFTADTWLVILNSKEGSKYKLQDVTESMSLSDAIVDRTDADSLLFDLQGRPVSEPLPGTIYLRQGRRFLVR